jgi:hypothetical protein
MNSTTGWLVTISLIWAWVSIALLHVYKINDSILRPNQK